MSQQPFGEAYGGSAPENYERYFVPVIGAPLAIDLVDIAALRPGDRVLDVACGTGVVARLASELVDVNGTVVGLDLNSEMLAVARAVTPTDMSIEWHQSDAEAMPLPDEAFDVAMCQLGLQFMPDKPAALREMRRVLAPDGRLVINVAGPTPPIFAFLDEALERHIGREAAGFVRVVFSLHDPGKLRDLLRDAGFDEVVVQQETKALALPGPKKFLWQYVHSTPLAAVVAQADDKDRSALERDFVARCQDHVEDGSLNLQQGVVVATARR
ncbi:MAG: methyltransferase domain-containing protein [Gemmatimonadota bacterium]